MWTPPSASGETVEPSAPFATDYRNRDLGRPSTRKARERALDLVDRLHRPDQHLHPAQHDWPTLLRLLTAFVPVLAFLVALGHYVQRHLLRERKRGATTSMLLTALCCQQHHRGVSEKRVYEFTLCTTLFSPAHNRLRGGSFSLGGSEGSPIKGSSTKI
jgi:hypothetical protein